MISDLTLSDVSKTKFLDDLRDESVLFFVGSFQLEPGGKSNSFANSKRGKKYIVLHDVSCILFESLVIDWN